jgi:hypothetical protein
MLPLQNTESVWWYVTREFEQTLGRPIDDSEVVAVTLVVSALTKLSADTAAASATVAPRARRVSARA